MNKTTPTRGERFNPADYLHDRDIPCHRCGYNLRGCREPQCPECGEVIPRPTATGRLPAQALRCLACGYVLGAPGVDRCPECGSDDITLGVRNLKGRIPPFRWRRLLLIFAVPVVLAFVVVAMVAT